MASPTSPTRSEPGGRSTTAAGALLKTFEKSVDDIRGLVGCKICTRLMFEPYVTTCGHSFCYTCLAQWLHNTRRNMSCPGCRAKITSIPVPDFTVSQSVFLLSKCPTWLGD